MVFWELTQGVMSHFTGRKLPRIRPDLVRRCAHGRFIVLRVALY